MVLLDTTDVQFDINLEKRHYPKEELEEKNFKIGNSSSKDHYIGGKLILAMDFDTCKPLTVLSHPGVQHDSKIFAEMPG